MHELQQALDRHPQKQKILFVLACVIFPLSGLLVAGSAAVGNVDFSGKLAGVCMMPFVLYSFVGLLEGHFRRFFLTRALPAIVYYIACGVIGLLLQDWVAQNFGS